MLFKICDFLSYVDRTLYWDLFTPSGSVSTIFVSGTFDFSARHCDRKNGLHTHFARQHNVRYSYGDGVSRWEQDLYWSERLTSRHYLPNAKQVNSKWTKCRTNSPWRWICMCRGGIKNKELGLWRRRGLLANVSAGVSVTTECLSGGKWLLYTTALWPWPSQSDTPFSPLKMSQYWPVLKITNLPLFSTDSMKSLRKTWDLTVLWDRSAFYWPLEWPWP